MDRRTSCIVATNGRCQPCHKRPGVQTQRTSTRVSGQRRPPRHEPRAYTENRVSETCHVAGPSLRTNWERVQQHHVGFKCRVHDDRQLLSAPLYRW